MAKADIEFSEEQIEYLKEIMQDEVSTLIKEEIQQNYIPRKMVEGMLEMLKKQKAKCDVKFRELFVDGGIWVIQEILDYKVKED